MKRSGIVYQHRADTSPEAEVAALCTVYRFLFDCHIKKKGRLLDKSGPDDAKESENVSRHCHRNT
jgi:hypothetical protein